MGIVRTLGRLGAVAATVGCLSVGGSSAWAGSTATTEHSSLPLAGQATFWCGGDEITVTGGTAQAVLHESTDGTGVQYLVVTLTMTGVTATDASGARYTIDGSQSSTVRYDSQQVFSLRDSSHYALHRAGGGVAGLVQTVTQFSWQRGLISMNLGGCYEPN